MKLAAGNMYGCVCHCSSFGFFARSRASGKGNILGGMANRLMINGHMETDGVVAFVLALSIFFLVSVLRLSSRRAGKTGEAVVLLELGSPRQQYGAPSHVRRGAAMRCNTFEAALSVLQNMIWSNTFEEKKII